MTYGRPSYDRGGNRSVTVTPTLLKARVCPNHQSNSIYVQLCDRRQTRVRDNENAGASAGRYECQGHSAMRITMQQYAKWQCFVDGIGYGMFSMWVPLVQIETASIMDGSGSGSSRSNDYPQGGGSMLWTNRDSIWWGRLDQELRCEVHGHRRSNKSTPKARKEVMSP
eukprot:scaffold44437_cov57-Attheya_sp.AAC.4